MDKGAAVFLRLNSYTGVAVKTREELILIDPDIPRAPRGDVNPELILVSHSHPGHFSSSRVASLASPETRILGSWRVVYALRNASRDLRLIALRPGNVLPLGDTVVEAHGASHPLTGAGDGIRSEDHLSFAVTPRDVGKIYHMSDSTPYPGLKDITGVDIAILPVGLQRWNSLEEVSRTAEALKPRVALLLDRPRDDGLLNRWRDGRARRKLETEMARMGIKAVFLGSEPYHTG